MQKFWMALSAVLLTIPAAAQNPAPEYGWKTKIVFSLSLRQASFNNWAKGGENSLAWQTNLNSRFTRDEAKFNWDNKAKFTYGQSKVGDTGYFTQSAGVGYSRSDAFKARLGATIKETYTRDFPGYADDPDTPNIEKTRIEGGITVVAEVNRKLSENIVYGSELNVFSNLKAFNQIDVTWENIFTAKVAKYVNVTLGIDLVYDRDTIAEWQFREVLSAGFTYDIF